MTHHTPNGIGHFDICGPDIGALQDFYQGVFGWQIMQKGPGYALAGTPAGTANGALTEAEEAKVTIGIVVADIEAALGQAVKHGGSVTMPVVDNGWVRKAMLADPAGNQITVIQS
ncbi:VOC family protein [Sphingomonas sp. BGYR3]|uniref:VOC family protein n=1 Tax=Sphingomonas sp. BGYR3 TaxID=2975483 RepID=UPI0021A3C415|nr:VOC family protein [Sphingomonas sp. BGYR3]MDG5487666.1 VOC family protein [Sphingomonas sp. BGYR3]